MKETKKSFNDYLLKIKQDFNLSNMLLSSILDCSPAQASLFLNKKSFVSYDKIKKLAEWLKNNGKDIYNNYVFYEDDKQFYYHGSRQGIVGIISPNHNSKETLDFGHGFYLGASFLQSSTFVASEEEGKDRIYKFEFDTSDLNVLELNGLDWVFFVAYNRGKIPQDKSTSKLYQKMNRISGGGYDVIVGQIADDRMAPTMRLFFNNELKYEQLYECLIKLNIGKQWCLKTEKACERLKCVEVYNITDNYLRELIKDYATERIDDAVQASATISLDRNKKGKTFKQLLKEYGNK